MNVRKATQNDVPQIMALSRILFADEAVLQPQYIRGGVYEEDFVLDCIASSLYDVFVAELNGRIVGYAVLLEKKTPPYSCVVPYDYAYLMDIVVVPDCRGQGIGTQLIETARGWAAERGLRYVELNVLENNGEAVRLYERQGFRSAMRTMRSWV